MPMAGVGGEGVLCLLAAYNGRKFGGGGLGRMEINRENHGEGRLVLGRGSRGQNTVFGCFGLGKWDNKGKGVRGGGEEGPNRNNDRCWWLGIPLSTPGPFRDDTRWLLAFGLPGSKSWVLVGCPCHATSGMSRPALGGTKLFISACLYYRLSVALCVRVSVCVCVAQVWAPWFSANALGTRPDAGVCGVEIQRGPRRSL